MTPEAVAHPMAAPLGWIGAGLLGDIVLSLGNWPWGAIVGGLAAVVAALINADARRKAETIADLRDRVHDLERERDRDKRCGSSPSETR